MSVIHHRDLDVTWFLQRLNNVVKTCTDQWDIFFYWKDDSDIKRSLVGVRLDWSILQLPQLFLSQYKCRVVRCFFIGLQQICIWDMIEVYTKTVTGEVVIKKVLVDVDKLECKSFTITTPLLIFKKFILRCHSLETEIKNSFWEKKQYAVKWAVVEKEEFIVPSRLQKHIN